MSGTTPAALERVLAAEQVATRELANVPDWIWDGETLPVPIEAICDSHYGLLIEEHDDLAGLLGVASDTHLSGVLLPDAREIWLNAREAPVRRRFTVGHEIGHWVMHADLGRTQHQAIVHCRESEVREEAGGEIDGGHHYLDYPPAELDANQFAAAMLMPSRLITVDGVGAASDEVIGRRLAVSAEALLRRRWFLDQRMDAATPRAEDSG